MLPILFWRFRKRKMGCPPFIRRWDFYTVYTKPGNPLGWVSLFLGRGILTHPPFFAPMVGETERVMPGVSCLHSNTYISRVSVLSLFRDLSTPLSYPYQRSNVLTSKI
ncbi:hypothetical protein FRC16_005916, partial [Serendipita sp. 398]